jgi:cysteine desulfurase/selenocysteine lyase
MNAAPQKPAFDAERFRADFPLLSRRVHGKPLVYLDNANTAQKPRQVIEAVDAFYREHNANVARAVHTLGEEATSAYEAVRDKVAAFINAPTRDEIIFTSGTTQAINLVAYSYALPRLGPGDEILVTMMDHHANIVPWQLACARTGAKLKAAPITPSGELIIDRFIEMLTPAVKLAGVVHVSNVLGTINPVRDAPRAPVVPAALRCSSTARRRRRIWRSTCRRSAATSMRSRDTSCSGRPALACYGRARSICTRCHRFSAVER